MPKKEHSGRKSKGGAKAINLGSGDKIISVLVTDADRIGIATKKGHLMICETKGITPIGRAAKGIQCIKY